jgi:hypothetical protein
MYRKPGSPGVLKGVLSGPHAGGARLVEAAKLPRAARQRLADVLAGRAEPTPILHEGPGGLTSRFRAIWGALVAILALATLTAIGFADSRAEWAYQPVAAVAGYVAAAMLLAYSLLSLHRRRALASGSALAPGRYLLPLDVVEVPVPDASGDQRIVVTPLGDGRDARIRSKGKKYDLVIILDRGAELGFALRSERDGEHALRRLEHAQSLLEELTYARDLEKSLANDPFFDLRVDDSWASVAPSGPESKKARGRRRLLHGPHAPMGALTLGAVLGWAAFHGRNWASDRALYLRALRLGTTDALEAYLVRGRSYRDEAVALRDRLNAQRADFAKHAAESRAQTGFEGPPRAEWELTPEEAQARGGSTEKCIAALRGHTSPAHPKATPIIEALVRHAGKSGDNVIPVRVYTQEGMRPASVAELDHDARASSTIRAFERILSETCPASLVKLARRPIDPTSIGTPGLDVKIDLTWPPAPTWKVEPKVHAPIIAFDVTLRGVHVNDVVSFRLTIPPPDVPPTSVRPRSLFVVPAAAAGDGSGRIYRLLTARAFDRLYDEIYGLFFGGDPRVPLREEEH